MAPPDSPGAFVIVSKEDLHRLCNIVQALGGYLELGDLLGAWREWRKLVNLLARMR